MPVLFQLLLATHFCLGNHFKPGSLFTDSFSETIQSEHNRTISFVDVTDTLTNHLNIKRFTAESKHPEV
jgi:hypothetical protein